MTAHRTITLALASLALVGLTGATAQAAAPTPQAAARKAVRAVAASIDDARPSRDRVTCAGTPDRVGERVRCSGSFRLTDADGRTARYVLGPRSRALRLSPAAPEGRVDARTTARGFPRASTS